MEFLEKPVSLVCLACRGSQVCPVQRVMLDYLGYPVLKDLKVHQEAMVLMDQLDLRAIVALLVDLVYGENVVLGAFLENQGVKEILDSLVEEAMMGLKDLLEEVHPDKLVNPVPLDCQEEMV